MPRTVLILLIATIGCQPTQPLHADHIRDLQASAVKDGKAEWGHWGPYPEKYSAWVTHSNRLIPIYTFGIKLDDQRGEKCTYRNAGRIKKLYGCDPPGTLNPTAEYFDQTDVADLQLAAAKAGKKHIVLFVFDGMDWQTTWAAAVHASGKVGYTEGRGAGLGFQDYRGTETDYGWFVTSPHNEGTKVDVNTQTIVSPGSERGGFAWELAGSKPWEKSKDINYLIAKSKTSKQAYVDSAASATALCAGIKAYNDSINVDVLGRQAVPVAQQLQKQGWAIGVVTSVPISHATPACAYANNVHRDDYQDLTRDLIGLPSIAHPNKPLPGIDVLLGGGWGESKFFDKAQGDNFIRGNVYLADNDLKAIDAAQTESGKYRVAQRTSGVPGAEGLQSAADEAAAKNHRLLGFYGVKGGHLPFATADGKYDPTLSGAAAAESYSEADLKENPTLADFTRAALTVLSKNDRNFWLMIEAGDVDWANHANNIDNSIGAVLSGDAAFKVVTDWVEAHKAWDDTAVIVTSDHGHYFFLEKPEALITPR